MKQAAAAQVPSGERVYAIGDLHGEAGLFQRLLSLIDKDSRCRGPAKTTLILLGDVIDRGEHAAELLFALRRLVSPRFVLLKGNHEAALVAAYRGDIIAFDLWLRFGGRATLAGLGICQSDDTPEDRERLLSAMRRRLPFELIDWLERLPLSWLAGDYFFTHAGVRPGVRLDRQASDDLLWIREPFLSSRRNHGRVIVHGHTVEEGLPRLGANRIGLDTGAHQHGRLTALGLEDDRQWLLQADAAVAEPIDRAPAAAEREDGRLCA